MIENEKQPIEIIKYIENYKVIEYEKTNIYIIENIIDSSFCEDIIELIDRINLNKLDYMEGNNVKCYANHMDKLLKLKDDSYYEFSTQVDEYKTLMNKDIVFINKLNGLTVKHVELQLEKINKAMQNIDTVMKEVNNKIVFEANSGYCLRKIYGKTRNHIDSILEVSNTGITFIKNNKMGDYKMVRNASIIFALNDNYEGGEFKFTYHDVKVKLKKGSVIIFPPFWTHPHETEELLNDTYRYTINTWSCQKIN